MAHRHDSRQRRDQDFTPLRSAAKRGKAKGLKARILHVETFEQRNLLAIGPQLLAVQTDPVDVLTGGQVLHSAPTELTFRFDSTIDATTLTHGSVSNITLTRGGDHVLGNGNDINVPIGFLGIGNQSNEVVARFASALPDDVYQIKIVGSGSQPLKSLQGGTFNNAQDYTQNFTLDLGAQIVSVVPQPVSRNASGQLTQAGADNVNGTADDTTNEVDVYFDTNNPLDSSATNTNYYELIRTTGAGGTSTKFNPSSVTYDPTTGKAVLMFASNAMTAAGGATTTYQLRVGNNDPLPLAPTNVASSSAGSSFGSSQNLGTLFTNSLGTQSVDVSGGYIGGSPISVIMPGGDNEPGTRNINVQDHLLGGPDTSGQIPVYEYNFQSILGTVGGNTVFNVITEVQKQRVREVLSYYANYLGVEFVETASGGLTIGTGDVRPSIPTSARASAASRVAARR